MSVRAVPGLCSQRLDIPETFNQEMFSISSLCVPLLDLWSSQYSRQCTLTPETTELFNLLLLIRITNVSAADERCPTVCMLV